MRVRATQKVMYRGDWRMPGEEFDPAGGDLMAIEGYLASGAVVAVEQEPARAMAAAAAPRARPTLSKGKAPAGKRQYSRRDMEAAKK